MTKIFTLPRATFVNEILFDNNVLDTNDGTKFNGTATNLTYSNSDVGYVYKQGVFTASTTVTLASTVNSVLAFSFWLTPTAHTKTICSYTGGSVTITSGTLLASTGLTSPTYYVNTVETTTLTLNVAQYVTVLFSSINIASLNIGASSYVGNMGMWRMLNATPNQQAIDTLYKEGQKKLGGQSYSGLMDGLVAQFNTEGTTVLSNVIGGTTATFVGGAAASDNFGNTRALTNPNYTWTSITYTTGYSFENSGGGWAIVTSPSGLSATGINRTTTLREIFLFSRTLSASEVTALQNACNRTYPFPY